MAAVAANMAEGIFTLDSGGAVTYLNAVAEELLGWTLEELHGRVMHDVIHYERPDGSPFPMDECDLACVPQVGRPLRREYDVFIRKDGTRFPVSYSSSALTAAGFRGSVVVFQDISERVERTEHAELLKRVLEVAELGTYVIDLDRRTISMSREMVRLLGAGEAPLELALDDYRRRFYHPDDLEPSVALADRTYQEGGDLWLTTRVVRGDGEIIWSRNRSAVETRGDGSRRVLGVMQDVTAEVRSRERDRLLATLVESSNDVMLTSDINGFITSWNSAAERLYGYRADEVVGRHVTAVAALASEPGEATAQADALSEHLRHLVANEPIPQLLLQRRHRDGEPFIMSASASPLRDDDGRVVGVALIGRDVTELERAHTEIRTSEERFRALVQHASDLIGLIDEDGTLRYVSPSLSEITGRDPAEVIGRPFIERAHPDDAQEVSARFERLVRDRGSRANLTYRVVRKDGAVRHVEAIATNLLDVPEVQGIVFNARDVTDLMHAHHELEKSYEELQRRQEQMRLLAFLVESSNDAIISKALDGTITSWNSGATRLFGYTADEIIGRDIAVLVPPDRLNELSEILDRIRQGEQVNQFETLRVTKSGAVIEISVTMSPLYGDNGTLVGASIIAVDISDRRRREREQREFERRVNQLERLESLGQLAGGIAHDFNNLLFVIGHYSSFVERELGDPERALADLGQIREATDRAASLTHQLLAFARRETTQPQVLDLNDVVAQVHQLLHRTIGEHIDMSFSLQDGLWSVEADPGQIEQILINLMLNARDAMPQGGSIMVDTSNVTIDEQYAQVRPTLTPGRYVRLRVSDTGTGMDQGTLDRVFEPFFTTKAPGEGTGLGLPSVYGIVTQAGGDIHLYSEVGVGTTCRVLLPASAAAPEPLPAETAHQPPGGTETVLLVEDEGPVRMAAERILAEHGYAVLACASGDEAISVAKRHGSIDVLLTDMVMPQMLGTEVADRVRALVPGVAVLYMSGHAESVIGRVLPDGVALLDKPFTVTQLLTGLRAVLDHSD